MIKLSLNYLRYMYYDYNILPYIGISLLCTQYKNVAGKYIYNSCIK